MKVFELFGETSAEAAVARWSADLNELRVHLQTKSGEHPITKYFSDLKEEATCASAVIVRGT